MADDSPRYDFNSPATVPFSVGKLFMLARSTAVSKNELPLAASAMTQPVRHSGGTFLNPGTSPRRVA